MKIDGKIRNEKIDINREAAMTILQVKKHYLLIKVV